MGGRHGEFPWEDPKSSGLYVYAHSVPLVWSRPVFLLLFGACISICVFCLNSIMWLFFLMTATLYLTALALHRITIPYTVVAPPHTSLISPPHLIVATCTCTCTSTCPYCYSYCNSNWNSYSNTILNCNCVYLVLYIYIHIGTFFQQSSVGALILAS